MSNIKIKSKNLNVYYGDKQALFDVNLDLNEKEVTALIGPSGCGKSTFIRCIIMHLMKVDLPHPDGPINAVTSFSFRSKLTSNNACLSP